ncbi:hypothetical protein ACS0TY_031417 [Phlomoides rotata]
MVMGTFTSMLMVFLMAFVLTSPAKAIDYKSAILNGSCCNAARNLIGLHDVDGLCKCFEPIASQFLPLKAQQLHGLCSLGAAHFPRVKCLASPLKSADGLPLPPLSFPLPPLPFAPLPPLPFAPLPPLPFGPLPPLPFPLPLLPFPLLPLSNYGRIKC